MVELADLFGWSGNVLKVWEAALEFSGSIASKIDSNAKYLINIISHNKNWSLPSGFLVYQYGKFFLSTDRTESCEFKFHPSSGQRYLLKFVVGGLENFVTRTTLV